MPRGPLGSRDVAGRLVTKPSRFLRENVDDAGISPVGWVEAYLLADFMSMKCSGTGANLFILSLCRQADAMKVRIGLNFEMMQSDKPQP